MKPILPTKPTKDVDRIAASWLCQLLDCVAWAMEHPRGDGRTILNKAGGILEAIARGGGTPGGGSSSYTGPFAVVQKNSTTVTIVLVKDSETYFFDSAVISGLSKKTFTGNQDLTITVSGVIYADITYTSAYQVAFANAATLPAQSTTHLYVPIATVTFAALAITGLRQELEGQIYPTQHGRAGG